MPDLSFPVVPGAPVPMPAPVELVVRRSPLASIREVLAISLDDLVNEREVKRVVYDLYRVSRRVESEAWLRRRLADVSAEAWIAAHL